MFECEVIPRPDSTPEMLKHLGKALDFFFSDERCHRNSDGSVFNWDRHAVASLQSGEFPQNGIQGRLETAETLREWSGLPPMTGAERRAEVERCATEPFGNLPGADLGAVLDLLAEGVPLTELDQAMEARAAAARRAVARRSVFFTLRTSDDKLSPDGLSLKGATGGSEMDRARLVAMLRRAVPPHLVEDVLIGGAGWGP